MRLPEIVVAALSMALAAPAGAGDWSSASEMAQGLRQNWDLLGLEFDATASHTLAYLGPRYVLSSEGGLFVDASVGVGVTLRDGDLPSGSKAPPAFGQWHAMGGYVVARRLKNREAIFNLYQSSSGTPTSGTTTTYTFLETQVIAERQFIVVGGARGTLGRGPDLNDTEVAPAWFALAGGVAMLTTWRDVQDKGGEKRLLRGIEGWEAYLLYSPQNSAADGFSNFRHWGVEFRYNRTTELGKGAWPFHVGLGMEPGMGPTLRIGVMLPVMSPVAGAAGSPTGEFR